MTGGFCREDSKVEAREQLSWWCDCIRDLGPIKRIVTTQMIRKSHHPLPMMPCTSRKLLDCFHRDAKDKRGIFKYSNICLPSIQYETSPFHSAPGRCRLVFGIKPYSMSDYETGPFHSGPGDYGNLLKRNLMKPIHNVRENSPEGAGTFLSSDFTSFFAPKASSRDFTDIWNAELFDYDTCPLGQPSDEKTVNFIRSQQGKGKNTGVFPCSNCGKVYTFKGNLKRHLKESQGNEIEDISGNPVVDCKSSAIDHAVTEANEDDVGTSNIPRQETHHCPRCRRYYRYKSSMLRHYRLECGKEPQFNCPYCPVKLTQRSYVRIHIQRRHKGMDENHKATAELLVDVISMIVLIDLSPHSMNLTQFPLQLKSVTLDATTSSSISGAELFCCTDCGKVYRLYTSLARHKRRECGKEPEFQCPLCLYQFKHRFSLERHFRLVHGISIDSYMLTKS
uniref:C2H2-type domain-containing protein n=1 Tax=Timema genevievae TaxID=629358 RepID=A0A7R9JMW9_TIMGE|nr:unnamed protein product [Timema genevievae]